MKLLNIAHQFTLALLIAAFSGGYAVAQDDDAKTDSKTQNETIAKLLKELNGHMNDGDWSEVKEMMTDEAWDSYCSSLVLQCVSLTKVELDGIDIPGLEDSKDEIIEVLEAHGLDKLKGEAALEIRVDGDSEEEEKKEEDADEEDSDNTEQEENEIAVLAILDKDGNRKEVVQALFQARKLSPFNMSVFAGEVLEVDAEEKSDSLTVQVKPKPEERDSEGGIQLTIMGPPTFIVIKKVEDKWMYAGVDVKKTTEAAENFRPDMGDGPRTDF